VAGGGRGGGGKARRGEEPSRYDCDDLHDANPLVLGTRTGWPSDAPIPLCLGKTPASAIPPSGSLAGGTAPRLFVASGRSKVQMEVGQDQDISGWEAPGTVTAPTVASRARVPPCGC